jgi:hypothetical protein
MLIKSREYAYYRTRDGSIPDELWSGIDGGFKRGIIESPAWGRAWARIQTSSGEPSLSHVAEQMGKVRSAS